MCSIIQRDFKPGQVWLITYYTNVCFKNLWTKFWDCCCHSTIYQIFLIQIAFQSSDKVKLCFEFQILRDWKKSNFPPKGPTTFKFWVMKLLLLLITNMQKFQVCYVGLIIYYTNVRFKNLWTKFWDRCCHSTMYQIFLIQTAFQSSDKVKLCFEFQIPRDWKKSNFPPKGPTTFKFWVMKLLLLRITNMQKFLSLLCWI